MLKLTARIKKDLTHVHWHVEAADVARVVDQNATWDEVEEREIFGIARAVLSGKFEI